jgi:hypothetical protein
VVLLAALAAVSRGAESRQVAHPPLPAPAGAADTLFVGSGECMACHNGLTTPAGEDVSIGVSWRASIMANSSRDPYWQAGVRREILDHPSAAAEIEHECSICHMPMAHTAARAAGRRGQIFAHLPIGDSPAPESALAADGVSCTLCHQIAPDRLGTPESFTGGFVVKPAGATGSAIFGPFKIDAGRTRIMHSAAGVMPTEATHIQQSELCATCHTLYTQALGPDGAVIASLPEQVPYLEWRHSAFRSERSCQACHMPEVAEPTPVSSVLGDPRPGVSRHTFVGGNFFMLRLLNRYRTELGVAALPAELEANARATVAQLQRDTAALSVTARREAGGAVSLDVTVRNLTGHKFPTGYPARRTWLHVVVADAAGRTIFESGRLQPSGAIDGNDNDADPLRFEPHYDEITRGDEVQIYESMMADAAGAVTTGLLKGTRFLKDNRLLPRGFDKASAAADIAVRGDAAQDGNFTDAGDRVRYRVDAGAAGPVQVRVELLYQPIGFRWARNLVPYDAPEPRRFVAQYESMSPQSSVVVATARADVP